MRVIVVGAGASGVLFALAYKRSHHKDEVILLEHKEEPLKKILATGNGKCNLGNTGPIKGIYNSSFAEEVIRNNDIKTQLAFLDSLNIKTKDVNGLIYPISESAVTVRNALLKALEKANIKVYCSEEVNEYSVNDNSIDVYTNTNHFVADKLIISTGGNSSPSLGSDGSMFNILKDHGYIINPVNPGLCPIYVNENVKALDGVRVKANVTLLKNNKVIHKESGEVLFKDKGLSGIVIFNISRLIARESEAKYDIKIDFLPNVDDEDLGIFLSFNSSEDLLNAYLHPKLATYLLKENKSGFDLISTIKRHHFSYKKSYGFEFSQISVGGLSLKEIKENFESKREHNVFFIGEVLDVDGPCGGYNLMWAFGSALDASSHI